MAGAFFRELRRRNVLRAGALYIAAVWAFGQGLSQFSPAMGLPDWATRWFLVAAVIGFPFWLAIAWFYEFTPSGLKRESEIDPVESIAAPGGRKLDFWIIGILCVAVVLLLTAVFVPRKSAVLADVATPATVEIPQKSIAVLPFSNPGGDNDQQYFSDGLTEGFINALSRFDGLKVIGRNSAFLFRNSKDDAQSIGVKLGVAHLLGGSVRREGEIVRISADLINTNDASTLWSQHYDRPYKDLFALQDDITDAVASALQTKLLDTGGAVPQSDRPPSGNLAAYIAYLQGKFQDERGTEADTHQAIAQYQKAIQADPRYALAYAGMSLSLNTLGGFWLAGPESQQAFTRARAAANTALALNPNLAAAHGARGTLLLNADFDWAGAQAEYQRAAQLAPVDAASLNQLGVVSARLGDLDQALKLFQKALATEPLSAGLYNGQSIYLSGLGRLDEATASIQKAIALQPTAVSYHLQLAIIEIQRGDAQAALAEAQAEPTGLWQDVALALARQIGPDHAAADAALYRLIEVRPDASSYQIAEVYALRRDPDQMFKWLDRAWDTRDSGVGYLLFDPFILRYQHDPRFAALCQKVGLPTTTNAKALP